MSRFTLAGVLIGFLAVAAWSDETPAPQTEKLKGTFQEKLNTKVVFRGCDDPKTNLIEILDQLAYRYGVVFHVNEKAFALENITYVFKELVADPDPIPPMTASFGTVLKSVLARINVPSGAAYVIRDEFIEITTREAISREFFGGRLRFDKLPPLVQVRFEKQSLPKALKELARLSGKNVLLDPRAAEGNEAELSIDLTNVPLDTAVLLLADMASLAMVQLDNVYYVTFQENAERCAKNGSHSPRSSRT